MRKQNRPFLTNFSGVIKEGIDRRKIKGIIYKNLRSRKSE
jgi:hypothetical protein